MKIQNTGKTQSSQLTRGKKSAADGAFQSLLNAEIDEKESANSSAEQKNHPDSQQKNITLLEEAVQVLDHTLSQFETGHVPDAEVLDTIQQLRSQLRTQNTNNSRELHQADTLLAVEAERIKSLNNSIT